MEVAGEIARIFSNNGFYLTGRQVEQFRIYHDELLNWNRKANLISKKDEMRVVRRHFLESASLFTFLGEQPGASVLDLGTGAGFPGVPLKIMMPQITLVLLDSKRWKGLFLKHLIGKLELDKTVAVCDRAESLIEQNNYSGQFDLVVSRAVARLQALWPMAEGFLRTSGCLVCIKGSAVQNEIIALRKSVPGIEIEQQSLAVSDHELQKTCVVLCRKTVIQ